MALTETTDVDKCEVLANGTIQARWASVVKRDGVEISRKYVNRKVYHPGADVSGAPAMVQAIADVEHTEAAIAAYDAMVEANEARRVGGLG